MKNLTTAKRIITQYVYEANCGIYNSRNIMNDVMFNIYDKGDLVIDICKDWRYFEVFGLDDEDFEALKDYYNLLVTRHKSV